MTALTQHIEALNAQSQADADKNGFVFTMESCAKYWAEMGITTIDQWERCQLESEFSDTYKEAHGIRPRLDTSNWSLAKLQAAIDEACVDMQDTLVREEAMHIAAAKEFEASVTATIESGAGDRATALRWLREADQASEGDDGYFEYNNGLEYGYWAKHCA